MHLFFIDLDSCQNKVLHVTKQLRSAVIFHMFIQIRNHFLEEKTIHISYQDKKFTLPEKK